MTIRQNILWKNMLLSFGIMIIAYMGMALPEWLVSADWGDAFRPSALQQSIIGIFFGGMMLLLPLCAGITSGLEQAGEILSSMFVWKLGRSSIGKYARSQLVSAFLRSAFCVWAAFAVNAALWNIIAHPCDIAAYPYHEIGFAEDCLYAEWYCWRGGILMYLWMGAGIFICGGVWGLVSMAVSMYLPDRIMAIAIPTCIYYFLSSGIFRRLLGWEIPHPSTLYNDALTWPMAGKAMLENAVISGLSVFLYIYGIRRRIRHA